MSPSSDAVKSRQPPRASGSAQLAKAVTASACSVGSAGAGAKGLNGGRPQQLSSLASPPQKRWLSATRSARTAGPPGGARRAAKPRSCRRHASTLPSLPPLYRCPPPRTSATIGAPGGIDFFSSRPGGAAAGSGMPGLAAVGAPLVAFGAASSGTRASAGAAAGGASHSASTASLRPVKNCWARGSREVRSSRRPSAVSGRSCAPERARAARSAPTVGRPCCSAKKLAASSTLAPGQNLGTSSFANTTVRRSDTGAFGACLWRPSSSSSSSAAAGAAGSCARAGSAVAASSILRWSSRTSSKSTLWAMPSAVDSGRWAVLKVRFSVQAPQRRSLLPHAAAASSASRSTRGCSGPKRWR